MVEDRETDAGKGSASEFAREAEGPSHGIVSEFLGLLRHTKKWWLTPVIVVLMILGALVFLFGTGAAPLIYTLF